MTEGEFPAGGSRGVSPAAISAAALLPVGSQSMRHRFSSRGQGGSLGSGGVREDAPGVRRESGGNLPNSLKPLRLVRLGNRRMTCSEGGTGRFGTQMQQSMSDREVLPRNLTRS
jgi:hypothetical protein